MNVKEFDYTAVTEHGQTLHGVMSAANVLAVDRQLEERGLTATRVRARTGALSASASPRWAKGELVAFTNQAATLISSGVPIMQGLAYLAKGVRSRGGRSVMSMLMEDLSGGASLADALDRQPRAFPDIYRAAMRAGEMSGETPTVLRRMASFLEWHRAIRATTIQALVYPAILCCAILGLVILLLTFLLPRILTLFPGGPSQLPAETRFVMNISNFLIHNYLLVAAVAGVGAIGLAVGKRNLRLRIACSRLLLGIPRLGSVARMIATARFAFTAHILHHSGCEVFQSLRIAGSACGNSYLSACFDRIADRVHAGSSITEGMNKEPLMDPMLVQVTAIGEQSGELDQALGNLAKYYDEEVPRTVKWFLSLFEPMLLAGAAVVVAFILMACLMPIFSLYENL